MNPRVIEFCAREVAFQYRGVIGGQLQVWWMLEAWKKALDLNYKSRLAGLSSTLIIQELGHMVEREKNPDVSPSMVPTWRAVRVRVGDSIKAEPGDLLRLMQMWCEHVEDMGPEEAYHQFEEIHPFVDGNGRVGKIIYNWKSFSLENPTFPSTYKEDDWQKENGFRP